MTGEEKLRRFAEEQYAREDIRVNGRVELVKGLGHSNAVVIEGRSSLILVDSLDSDERGKRLRSLLAERYPGKPVKTIFFTHSHPDHRGGSGAFREDGPEVIMHAPAVPQLKHYDRIAGVLKERTIRQFGYELPDGELIAQGLGIREGHSCGDGRYDFLQPTRMLEGERNDFVIDGVPLSVVSAPGETDDQVFIWLPEDGVLCCGDNYYPCWPNLYAIRGSRYRDISAWAESLRTIISYGAEVLLPGHMSPVFGAGPVRETLSRYCEAIEFVLFKTLDCMEQGMSMQECVDAVRLPEHLASLPYLQEFYGTVAWSVKGVYSGYLGWFDGNPANLDPLPEKEWAELLLELSGGVGKVAARIGTLYEEGRWQAGVQLCGLLAQAGRPENSLMRRGLAALGRACTSANGRHYHIVSAKKLKD